MNELVRFPNHYHYQMIINSNKHDEQLEDELECRKWTYLVSLQPT